MFGCRRSVLLRRLWSSRCTGVEDGDVASLKLAARSIFQRLRLEQLERLCEALNSGGAGDSACVLVPRTEIRSGPTAPGGWAQLTPQLLLCRLFRWPDLRYQHEIKRLHCCPDFAKRDGDRGLVCVNPYHFSRLAEPETPPPPYTKCSRSCSQWTGLMDWSGPGDAWSKDPSTEQCSNCYETSDSSMEGYWCRLAYWEHRTRVGCQLAVQEEAVSVFWDLPRGSGLCLSPLKPLGRGERGGDSSSRRVRKRIGPGVVLSREGGGVWLYNRSQVPVFVGSPTLLPPDSSRSACKLLPGYSLKVFDYRRIPSRQAYVREKGPWDPHCIRVSFAKGWGPTYSRRLITSCPCWLEILLNK
ncbi:mothers against decapentaplegic homolog 6-like [Erpetoichthys calabaricus]|uniref:Mothers against decapentaplegic homolog n=1 Tax=Erpetoichthys calabaricus TaxID=27687 RepID=A0A8C4RWX0_ERPCA|nr:mothers against decapentaplegic homolog 6-like [Erpetoichthys calabaricus]XP_028650683.1 mothers against decapentaplegic homolog 6-like [Erpetoichthys calabaricus]